MRPEQAIPCFDCEGGILRIELKDWHTTGGKGEPLVVPLVPHHVCDKCGETSLGHDANVQIEEARKNAGVVYRHPKRVDPKRAMSEEAYQALKIIHNVIRDYGVEFFWPTCDDGVYLTVAGEEFNIGYGSEQQDKIDQILINSNQ